VVMLGKPDEAQLEYATSKSMCLLTANIRDFLKLAHQWSMAQREHSGIVRTTQFRCDHFGELLRRVLKLLNAYTRDELRNQVIYLPK
jgi:hypothetical protein